MLLHGAAAGGALLHFNDTNGSTTIIDSRMGRSCSVGSTTTISTAQSMFGGSSLELLGGAVLTKPCVIAYGTDFDVGTGDMTAECWIRQTVIGGGFGRRTGNNEFSPWSLSFTSGTTAQLLLQDVTGGAWGVVHSFTGLSISTAIWYHWALVKNGSTWTLYQDGVASAATASYAIVYDTNVAILNPPIYLGPDGGGSVMNGYFDDFRYSTTAVYTSNFTPSGPLT
jgi:hypothetical protein